MYVLYPESYNSRNLTRGAHDQQFGHRLQMEEIRIAYPVRRSSQFQTDMEPHFISL